MALHAIRRIDETRNKATDTTLRNCFHAVGFSRTLSDQQTFQSEAVSTDDGSNQDPIKHLDDLLSHVRIDSSQRSATEVVNIDSNIPAFNEWNNNRDFLVEIVGVDHIEANEYEQPVKETPSNLSEAPDMPQRLHLLASTKHRQLQWLASDL